MSADAEALAAAWAARVRANRQQVDGVRAGVERDDFYAPVSSMFVDDPRRTGDATLDALRGLAEASDVWLDVGAGAGRYALPLALVVAEVIAVEPSPAMANALRDELVRHGIGNVRVVEARWPMPAELMPRADVALIAHVGYDIEELSPFLDGLEQAARRLCVAVLMDRSPSSLADPFWPPVHGQDRVPLPALDELVELLQARGAAPTVDQLLREPRTFASEEQLLLHLRQQLWVQPGSEADGRLMAAMPGRVIRTEDGLRLAGGPSRVGVVTWVP